MLRTLLAGIVLTTGAAAATRAQGVHARSGLWAGLGLGIGSAQARCSVCGNRVAGPAAHARLGGTISPKLLLGVQGSGWLKSEATRDRSFLMLSALGTLYAWPDHGFYMLGGIGGYRYVEEDTDSRLTTQGLALHVGAGLDVRIARGMSLSPFADLVISGSGNPTRRDKSSGFELPLLSDMTLRYFELGVAATLH